MAEENENEPIPDISKVLAIIDIFPVLFACVTLFTINSIFKYIIFLIGAIFVVIGGLSMILYKFILAFFGNNYPIIKKPMIICMSIGFILFITSIILKRNEIEFKKIWSRLTQKKLSLTFLILGICGMICMGIFAMTLDSKLSSTNYLEEITNSFGQGCFMIVAILYKINLKEEIIIGDQSPEVKEEKTEMSEV